MDVIVLAGGLGTRLRSVVAELPKAMAPVAGRPFLEHLLDVLALAGFASTVLAVGYRADAIREHFGDRYRGLPLTYSVEGLPLGTGGAIRLAMNHASSPEVFVVNGDTFVDVDFSAMLAAHRRTSARLTIAVHEVPDAARYGALDIAGDRVRGFFEKGRVGPGWINAGVYLLARTLLDGEALPTSFSFESDYLVPNVEALRPLAFRTDGLFIDIGVPEDYASAQSLLATPRSVSFPPRARW
jgi:D-glycero-alpha-D-manno-heptose 1-phosphate guanylyltransferase